MPVAAILVAGILPLFDQEFARGFSDKIAGKVAEVAANTLAATKPANVTSRIGLRPYRSASGP